MEYGNGAKNNLHRVRQIESVCEKSTRAQHAWDSGLSTVLVTDLLTQKRVGTQYPGCNRKNFNPHRLEKADHEAYFVRGRVRI